MTSPRRRAFAAVAAVAASLLLVACNSSNAADTVPTSPSTSRSPSQGSTDLGEPNASTDSPSVPASAASTAASTPEPAETGGDACSLVTEQEVGAALGGDPGAGSPFTSHGATQCQYGSYQTAFALVNVLPTQGQVAYDRVHGDPHTGDAGTLADVDGVGDRAFSIAGPHTASIYFNTGDQLVLVMVEILADAGSPMDQALSLAKIAAGRV